jgi:hypothetical protein
MLVLKVSTYMITDYPIELAAILVIMSVSTFKTDVILYVHSTELILSPRNDLLWMGGEKNG